MASEDVYIVSACRTAIGSFNGQYSKVSPSQLGAVVIKNCLQRANVAPEAVSEVIMGQILTAGHGQNPARQAAKAAGVPLKTPAYTINMLCGSGLKAVQLGFQAIRNGDAKIVVCGGQESMTQAHYTAPLRAGVKVGSVEMKDSLLNDGLTCFFTNLHMGGTAEFLAQKYHVSRERQDKFAYTSQMRATKALREGYFAPEIVPVEAGGLTLTQDEFVKPNITLEKLAQLRPLFETDPARNPTVTAGNASGMNDAAAAVIVAGKTQVEALKLKPLARIVAFAQAGLEPAEMGLGPVPAVQALLQKTGWNKDSVDLYELNEAFASQSLLVLDQLGLDHSKVNVTGGAIALGHPLGAAGTRVLVTLLYNLERLQLRRGVASLCIGGGMGIAVAVERCSA